MWYGYDPVEDFAYHLGYSYEEAEEMLTKREKDLIKKEIIKKGEVEEKTDTK